MQVDWADGTIPYFDSTTGEEYKAYLFIAALPCSNYLYVEACTDMKMENWLMCHVHAYSYFGGVTRILVPDNLKTGVTANTRYETQLNESYRELAEYYGTAVVPARVRKPQDKGLVERSVGFSTTWIIAALREQKFFSFSEVRKAVAEKLEIINTKPFQKRPGNRREAYLSEGKEFMLPLPKKPYEPSVWKQQTVGKSTVEVVKHFLSSGTALEQGYKACVSLSKLGKRYGKKKLESACERILAFSSSPTIRNITTLLKNSSDTEKKTETDNSNKYCIIRGAAYWKKGGDGNAE